VQRSYLQHDRRRLILFLVPALLLVLGIQLVPFAWSAMLSFQDWTLTKSQTPEGWIGTENYQKVLSDPVFQKSIKNTAMITGFSVPVQILLGTALAYLTLGSQRIIRWARTGLILPMVLAPVAIGTLWRMLFNDQSGPINNNLLAPLGIDGPVWLGDPQWALVSVIIVEIWQWTPFVLLVMAAGASGIPDELVQSAAVDGASRWRTFWQIELPLLRPVLMLVVLFRTLESLITLDIVLSLTRGGPGYSSYNLTYFIYILGLRNFDIGLAAAASWLFMLVAVVLIALLFRKHFREEA
jgi:multiple sugar transport system permease protein